MGILEAITEKVRQRWQAYDSRAVTKLPDPSRIRPREWLIAGSFAQIGMTTRRRWVLDHGTISFDRRTIFESPSGVARAYLAETYRDAKHRRIYHEQARALAKSRLPMPLLADPCDLGRSVYLDIRRAYWQIMLIAGWDVDYYPTKWIMGGTPPTDFPFWEHATARNSLVSTAMNSTITQIAPDGEVVERRIYNPFLNMPLVTLVSHVLHGVATDLRRARVGLAYANTDGFIVSEKHEAKALATIARWGLSAKAKARGTGWVAGVGVYKVGKTESKRQKTLHPFSNLTPPPDVDTLRAEFCALAQDDPPAPYLLGIEPPPKFTPS